MEERPGPGCSEDCSVCFSTHTEQHIDALEKDIEELGSIWSHKHVINGLSLAPSTLPTTHVDPDPPEDCFAKCLSILSME